MRPLLKFNSKDCYFRYNQRIVHCFQECFIGRPLAGDRYFVTSRETSNSDVDPHQKIEAIFQLTSHMICNKQRSIQNIWIFEIIIKCPPNFKTRHFCHRAVTFHNGMNIHCDSVRSSAMGWCGGGVVHMETMNVDVSFTNE